jgi:hypothetical protein
MVDQSRADTVSKRKFTSRGWKDYVLVFRREARFWNKIFLRWFLCTFDGFEGRMSRAFDVRW